MIKKKSKNALKTHLIKNIYLRLKSLIAMTKLSNLQSMKSEN